eukprot:Awhi_evm3s14469
MEALGMTIANIPPPQALDRRGHLDDEIMLKINPTLNEEEDKTILDGIQDATSEIIDEWLSDGIREPYEKGGSINLPLLAIAQQNGDGNMKRLNKAKLLINRKKCCFGTEKAQFLGFVVSKDGIEIDSKKKKEKADECTCTDTVIENWRKMREQTHSFIDEKDEVTKEKEAVLPEDYVEKNEKLSIKKNSTND